MSDGGGKSAPICVMENYMTKKRLKMTTSREVRRAVNRITNMLLNGEIDPKTANAILYGCNVCLGAIRVDDQQAKIDELEQILEEMGKKNERQT